MDKIAQRLKVYIEPTPLILVTASVKPFRISFTKLMQSPTNPTRRKSATDLRNWKSSAVPSL